ncbi:MAG: hypothetical protein HOB88_04085 [Bacteroidetes bacterium]|nr:hypothetical protein [Bacteroidota bacterium]
MILFINPQLLSITPYCFADERKHLTEALAFFPEVKLDPSFLGIGIVGWISMVGWISIVDRISMVDSIGMMEWNYTLLLC